MLTAQQSHLYPLTNAPSSAHPEAPKRRELEEWEAEGGSCSALNSLGQKKRRPLRLTYIGFLSRSQLRAVYTSRANWITCRARVRGRVRRAALRLALARGALNQSRLTDAFWSSVTPALSARLRPR